MGLFDKIFKKNKDKSENNLTVEQNTITPRDSIAKPKTVDKIGAKQKKDITFKVAGVTFNGIQSKIKAMVKEEKYSSDPYEGLSNKEILEDYSDGDKIYEVDIYGSSEIKLVPDPQNKFDPNAIKIVHEEIGDIGYVPATNCKRIKKVLESGYSLEWKLIGGKSKYIEYDDEKDKDVVRTNNDTYGIMVTLTEI